MATGIQIAKLTASDAAAEDWFGTSVAISGTTAIVGANRDDDDGNDSGSAYIFENTCNTAPIANAGGPYVAEATGWGGAWVHLDGRGSYDADGDELTYEWDLDLAVDSDLDGDLSNDVDATGEIINSSFFPIGQTQISLVVTDEYGVRSEPDVTDVTVSFIDVEIEIKSANNDDDINIVVEDTINGGGEGVVSVAFLTAGGFDALTIDPMTVTLRGEEFSTGLVQIRSKKDDDDAVPPVSEVRDIDGDEDDDLVVHLNTEAFDVLYETDVICEIGALTYDGLVVLGRDKVHLAPDQTGL